MPLKFYKLILKIGALASFVGYFIVSNSLYFPYITGKQIYFNILIELLLVFWVAMLVRYPATRPEKKNWLNISIFSFLGALLISSAFGVDWNLSFWGDAERMLGWFHVAHFFILYLIITTAFTNKKDWLVFLSASVLSAASLGVYALATAQGAKALGNVNMTSNISTLGNATYVAGVMLANFWFVLYLFKNIKNWYYRGFLGLAFAFMVYGFFYADVSGSQAGLVAGVVTMLALYGFLNKNKAVRQKTLIAALAIIAVVAVLFATRWNSVYDNTKLGKMLRDFSYQNSNLNTRMYAWQAAIKGFKENPVLGSGYGNYAIYFDKYFQGSYYQWSTNEEYFDRAHNNLLDIACTGGSLSLLTYLSIFGLAVWLLIKAYRQGRLELFDFSLLLASLISYFVHNLAVFDSFANYISFMMMLGMVSWLTKKSPVVQAEANVININSKKDRRVRKLENRWDVTNPELAAWFFVGIFSLVLIFHYNYRFIRLFRDSITASRSWSTGDLKTITENWQKALGYNTPLDRDCRSLLVSQIGSNISALSKLEATNRQEIFDLAVKMQEENIKLNPKDVMLNLWAAQIYFYRGALNNSVPDMETALSYATKAVANGGQHTPPKIMQANILSALGRNDEAAKAAREAISWYPDYNSNYCYLIDYTQNAKDADYYDNLAKCYLSEQKNSLSNSVLLDAEKYYAKQKDAVNYLKTLETLYLKNPDNAGLKTKLEKAYQATGQTDKLKTLETK